MDNTQLETSDNEDINTLPVEDKETIRDYAQGTLQTMMDEVPTPSDFSGDEEALSQYKLAELIRRMTSKAPGYRPPFSSEKKQARNKANKRAKKARKANR